MVTSRIDDHKILATVVCLLTHVVQKRGKVTKVGRVRGLLDVTKKRVVDRRKARLSC